MFTTKESIHLPYIVMYNMIANMKEIAFQLIMTQILMHGVSLVFFWIHHPCSNEARTKTALCTNSTIILGARKMVFPLTADTHGGSRRSLTWTDRDDGHGHYILSPVRSLNKGLAKIHLNLQSTVIWLHRLLMVERICMTVTILYVLE